MKFQPTFVSPSSLNMFGISLLLGLIFGCGSSEVVIPSGADAAGDEAALKEEMSRIQDEEQQQNQMHAPKKKGR